MPEERVKRKTLTSTAAKRRYNEKNYDRLQLVVPKGKKAVLQTHAAGQGESLNGFVNRAIDETVERDKASVEGE